MADKEKAKAHHEKAPNVKLTGSEPLGPGPVNMGMITLGNLPEEDEQRAGFYFKQAQLLIQLFPDRYKMIVEKGKN